MASSTSTDLKLELITTGEKSGTWGTITNTNLQILEQAASGYLSLAVGSADVALSLDDGTCVRDYMSIKQFTEIIVRLISNINKIDTNILNIGSSIGLSNLELLLCLMVFYIVLGCFLDGISSIVLTMAVVETMIRDAGINVIWFGIYLTVLVEMAQITPPVGFNLFVLQGMTKHEMYFLAKSALPMFLVMVLMVFIMIAFPELATYLASTVRSAGAG